MDTSFSSPQGQPPNLQVNESPPKSYCNICNQLTNNTNCIKCSKCTLNFHLECANIANYQQNSSWLCQNCNNQPQKATGSAVSIRSGSTSSSHNYRQALELQRLQEETQLERDFIKKKYQILQKVGDDAEELLPINRSVHEWLNKQTNTDQQPTSIQEPINLITAVEESQHNHNETPYYGFQQQTASTTLPISITSAITICDRNLATNPVFTTATQPACATTSFNKNITSFINDTTNNNLHSTAENISNRLNNNINAVNRSSTMNYGCRPQVVSSDPAFPAHTSFTIPSTQPHQFDISDPAFSVHPSFTMPPPQPPLFCNVDPTISMHPSYNMPTNTNHIRRLTQQQINARQSVPKELPIFSGTSEEWPLFSSTYDWSTAVCGLTDAENLVRLQKALRGEALRSVQHILIHPYGVSCAISTLKLLYGQPEKILHSLKNKIKSLPALNINKLNTITSFAVEVKGLETTIRACGLLDELYNSTLLQELVSKMPSYFQLKWGEQKTKLMKNSQKIGLTDFANWIFEVGVSANSINIESNNNPSTSADEYSRKPRHAYINAHEVNTKRNCIVCFGSCNSVEKCKRFLTAERNERWNLIRKHNLCKQCLKRHNGTCNSRQACSKQGCEFKHHTLLHKPTADNQETNIKEENINKNNLSNLHAAHTEKTSSEILFKIMPITIYGNNNKTLETFAFIDEGSSISLVNEHIINELNLSGSPQPLCLKWTGNMARNEEDSKRVSLQISGGNKTKFSIDVRTVKQLSLPSQSLNYKMLSEKYPHLRGLPIGDFKNAVPHLLLGLNNLKLFVSTRVREGKKHEPVAMCTRLGWILCGNSGIVQSTQSHYNFHSCECKEDNDNNLNSLLKQFYSIETTGISCSNPVLGKGDQRAIDILKKYTKQRSDGHYEAPLLWRYDNITLPHSYDMAKKRLFCLEKNLKNNKDLYEVFQRTISEYLNKKYISKVDASQKCNNNTWYLPIFPVINKNKPKKTRLVWDAAAKANGVSLNCMLLKGPDLLSSLPAILFRFRQRHIAVCGDIEQMFHQIHIRKEDSHAQRFLWRGCDDTKDPEIYVMNVMIFGASCAPCISQYVKNLNASKFEKKYPLAAAAIKDNHYVDDFLTSTDTPEEAIRLASNVRYIHNEGGFNIRNWCSNNRQVLKSLNAEIPTNNLCINIGVSTETEKILGVFWIPANDIITFKISPFILNSEPFIGNRVPTKREVLKILMSIYDPLGLIGNLLMYLKIVLQEIWRSGVNWDDPIRSEQQVKWRNWLRFLPYLKNVNIPRCYLKTLRSYDHLDVQLHTFVDASESGYAAVAYFRISDGKNVIVSLIGSKTRVAPLKVVSIPRLELMAAVIGARFANYIAKNHTIDINRKLFWSDSRTVLSWIRSDHRKYHQFVAVRVSEILDISEINEWYWISTKKNVADEATKCSKPPNLSNTSAWFNGPEFLILPEQKWPNATANVTTTDIELKVCNLITQSIEPLINLERFSRWTRALRATALVVRFYHKLKNKAVNQSKQELTQEELCKAEIVLIKDTQKMLFHHEIECLLQNKKLAKSNFMYKLSPFFDNDGVLRISGRIDNANVPDELKHPVILPKYCRLTALLIWHYHSVYRHGSHETVVNEIRQRYYIPKLRVVCKSVIKKCQMCKIKNASPEYPMMGKLPRARLGTYLAPFTFTGIDYFGPMLITVNRHKEKRYGALFTCLTIRAVHIEIVHSLNTSSCIMAIRKFISRRGQPREFFSDNGTNFVGADRELREALSEVDKDELVRSFTTPNTKWNFNPPSAPHMGGAWERLVRSVKSVFYKIKLQRFPNDETLQSMLAEVENIINSRPLTYVPVESENHEAITPNHFLLGNSNGLKPLATYDDEGIVLRESWLCSQQYAQKFWKRWVTEYLPTLTCRTKWFQKAKPLAVGDLVIVVDPASPRNVWPKGRIIEVNKSEDGQVRKAKVMTTCGVLERPAVKLAILDVAQRKE